jgi:hypothetical protein
MIVINCLKLYPQSGTIIKTLAMGPVMFCLMFIFMQCSNNPCFLSQAAISRTRRCSKRHGPSYQLYVLQASEVTSSSLYGIMCCYNYERCEHDGCLNMLTSKSSHIGCWSPCRRCICYHVRG